MTLVNLTNPEAVATLILTAAVCQYDPGTAPWIALHEAADEIREAIAREHGRPLWTQTEIDKLRKALES